MNPIYLAAGTIPTAALAFLGTGDGAIKDFAYKKAHRNLDKQAIHEAMNARDYSAWSSALPEEANIHDVITEDTFDQFAKMHELHQSGDHDAAKEIREELGLPEFTKRRGHGRKSKRSFHKNIDPAQRQAIKDAMSAGDFLAWSAALPEGAKILDIITEENFDQFVQLHQLKKDGNIEEAQAIAEELGFPPHHKRTASIRQAAEA